MKMILFINWVHWLGNWKTLICWIFDVRNAPTDIFIYFWSSNSVWEWYQAFKKNPFLVHGRLGGFLILYFGVMHGPVTTGLDWSSQPVWTTFKECPGKVQPHQIIELQKAWVRTETARWTMETALKGGWVNQEIVWPSFSNQKHRQRDLGHNSPAIWGLQSWEDQHHLVDLPPACFGTTKQVLNLCADIAVVICIKTTSLLAHLAVVIQGREFTQLTFLVGAPSLFQVRTLFPINEG